MDIRIISIGTLAAHPLWGERTPVRTGHGTTTLIRSGKRAILVDPGLPEPAVAARLAERANLKPQEITHVFLTSFNPEMRRGLLAFDRAVWWISETEREQIGLALVGQLKRAAEEGDKELTKTLEQEVAILRRCEPSPDKLADRVDLFPLPGLTPGLSGLLVGGTRFTTLICGDAIPTTEHLDRGQVLPGAADVERARESFQEAVEIADLLIPGRDNLIVNPTRRPF